MGNYNKIRNQILIQSTVSPKLPGLIEVMLNPGNREEKELIQEFQKYAELIRYEDDKIDFLDSSRKIVEEYSQIPDTVSVHLATLVPELTKIFDSLPLSIQKTIKTPPINYTFDQTTKASEIMVSEDKKQAWVDELTFNVGGLILVSEGEGM